MHVFDRKYKTISIAGKKFNTIQHYYNNSVLS